MEPAWSIDSFAWDGYAFTAQTTTGSPCTGLGYMDLLTSDTSRQLSTDMAKTQKKGMKRTASYLPHCQVAGCSADLSHSRAYYRRYRICEVHFRAASMMIDSKVMRFCQQCAKFEPLCVFDGDKRSCRRQLNRHNERRSRRRNKRGSKRQSPGCSLMDSCEDSDDSSGGGMAHQASLPNGALADLMHSSIAVQPTSSALNTGQGITPAQLTPLQQQLLALQTSESGATGERAEDSCNVFGSTLLDGCTGTDDNGAVCGTDLVNTWPDISTETGLNGKSQDLLDPDYLNLESCHGMVDAAMKLVAVWQGQGQEQQQVQANESSPHNTAEPSSANSSVHGGSANTSVLRTTAAVGGLSGFCPPSNSNTHACNPENNTNTSFDRFIHQHASHHHQARHCDSQGVNNCNSKSIPSFINKTATSCLFGNVSTDSMPMSGLQLPVDGLGNMLWEKDTSSHRAGCMHSEPNHVDVPSHWRLPKPQSNIMMQPRQSQLHPVLASLTAHQAQTYNQPSASLPTLSKPASQPDARYPNIWASPLPDPVPVPLLPASQSSWWGVGRQAASEPHTEYMAQPNTTLAGKLSQADYLLVELSLTRLSIKLHGVTPEALPDDLRNALTEWLAGTDQRLLQGFIRPGCVHLTLDCITASKPNVDKDSHAASRAAWTAPEVNAVPVKVMHGLNDLLPSQPGGYSLPVSLADLFSSCTIVELQSPNKLVLMEGQAVWSVSSLEKRPNLAKVRRVEPLILFVGNTCQHVTVDLENFENDHRQGSGSSASPNSSCQVFVRSQGRFIQGDRTACKLPGMPGEHGNTTQQYRVSVDTSGLDPGLAVVEAQAGRLLSNFCPVLLVNDINMLQEIQQLQSIQHLYPDRINALITNLGLLLQLQSINAKLGADSQQHVAPHTSSGNDGMYSWSDSDDGLTAPSVSEGEGEDFDDVDWEGAEHEAIGMDAMATDIPIPHNPQAVEWESDVADNSWGSTMTHSALAYEHPQHAPRLQVQQNQLPASGNGVETPCDNNDNARHGLGWFSQDVKNSLANKALRLLAFACDAGWPSTARMLISLLTTVPLVGSEHSCHTLQSTMYTVEDVLSSAVTEDGTTLLLRAVRSGSLAIVRELLIIARTANLKLDFANNSDGPIKSGMSALHCAATLQDGSIALALLAASPLAPLQWFMAKSAEGFTPAELAMAGGCWSVNDAARMMVQRLAMIRGTRPT